MSPSSVIQFPDSTPSTRFNDPAESCLRRVQSPQHTLLQILGLESAAVSAHAINITDAVARVCQLLLACIQEVRKCLDSLEQHRGTNHLFLRSSITIVGAGEAFHHLFLMLAPLHHLPNIKSQKKLISSRIFHLSKNHHVMIMIVIDLTETFLCLKALSSFRLNGHRSFAN